MFRIRETDDGWVVEVDGVQQGVPQLTYEAALQNLAVLLHSLAGLAVDATMDEGVQGDGLLPERWEDVDGIAFSEPTGDGRDFTDCVWSFRDPAESLMPLMLQTETEIEHFGAVLAGFIETTAVTSGTPHASGRFYASDAGRSARDLLLDGRIFGVSVDPVGGEVEWRCVEEDEDGYCVEEGMFITAYTVGGLTMTPFPAFARAAIRLGTAEAEAAPEEEAPVEEQAAASVIRSSAPSPARRRVLPGLTAATITIPDGPPADWFDYPEALLAAWRGGPVPGQAQVTDEGRVYGYLAGWGTCHTGYPDECVSPPRDVDYDTFFHSMGCVVAADGTPVAVGRLTLGGGHASTRPGTTVRAALAHYDDVSSCVANVRCGEDSFGVWFAGALRDGVSGEDVVALRATPVSGDWRGLQGRTGHALVAAHAVNSGGFSPRAALAASGEIEALVAAGHHRPCPPEADPTVALGRDVAFLVDRARQDARTQLRGLAADRARRTLRGG